MADSLGGLLDPQALELLRQYMAQLAPSDEDKKAAKMQAITNFGLGLLGGRKGNELPTIGASGLNAMNQYQRDLTLGQAQRGQNINQAMSLMQMQKAQQAAQAQAALQQQVGSVFSGGPQPQNMGPGGPTPQNAAAAAPPSQIEQYRKAAALYAASGNTEGAKRMADIANSMEAEYSTSPQTFMREGKPVTALVGKRGEVKPLEGYGPKPDYKEVGTGQEKFFYDPLSGARAGNFQMQMSPGEVASNRIAQGHLGLAQNADQRAAAGQGANEWETNLDRGIQVNKRTGDTRPITSGGAPVGNALDQKRKQAGQTVNDILDIAEPLVKKATGSYAGAAMDVAANVFGHATEGAEKTAQLQAVEGQLMLAQPRMEGPQSDRDTAIYKQMAGKIGDPTVPQASKLAAMKVIRQIYKRYGGQEAGSASGNLTAAEADELAALKKKHGR